MFTFTEANNECNNEITKITMVKLCDISSVLISESTSYELQGVIYFRSENSNLRSSIGHYTTYTKSDSKRWKFYDDLKTKLLPVKDTTVVHINFYFILFELKIKFVTDLFL